MSKEALEVDILDETSEEMLEVQRMAEEMMTGTKKEEKDYEVETVTDDYTGEIIEVEVVDGRTPYQLSVEKRANSLAFEPVMDERTGEQKKDGFGNLSFQCIPVARKPKHLYCTECHDYKVFRKEEGLQRCPDCGMSDQDFYIKTANQLWEGMKKNND